MNIQKLDTMNRWQRIAMVLTVIWFSGWGYHFWQAFPTEMTIFRQVYALQSEEDKKAYAKRDEGKKACEVQSGGDLLKDLVSGCTRSVLEEHHREIEENKQWAKGIEYYRLEDLPKEQAIVVAKLLFIGLFLPLFLYVAISWISKAPKKASDISKP